MKTTHSKDAIQCEERFETFEEARAAARASGRKTAGAYFLTRGANGRGWCYRYLYYPNAANL
jgi:hypothetical protein